MKKNERLTLANIAARWAYGTGADNKSRALALELIKEFPSVVSDYNLLASSYASERIAAGLISVVAGDELAGAGLGMHFVRLIKNKSTISEEVEDWCDQNGYSAAQLLDQHVDLHFLARDETLKEHFSRAAQQDEGLILFAQLLASRSAK